MRLKRAIISGYRSIREPLTLDLDERITVILGANDHGKTNVLNALLHLNPDRAFDPALDLNWDYAAADRPQEFPELRFHLTLSADERKELKAYLQDRGRLTNLRSLRRQLEADYELAPHAANAAKGTDGAQQADATTPDVRGLDTTEVADPVETARLLLGLVYGEELRLGAQIYGTEGAEPRKLTIDTEAAAKASAAKAKRARSKATAARTSVAPLASPGKPTEAEQKLETDAKAAEAEADEAASQGAEDQRLAALARAAADAEEPAVGARNPFAKDPRWNAPRLRVEEVPEAISLERKGVGGSLRAVEAGSSDPEALIEFVAPRLPRVELFKPVEKIPDSATTDSIEAEGNDFMRGIFRYAGLDPDEWPKLFRQSDQSTKRLDRATDQLNETLRAAWSQGKDLKFKLDHRHEEIDLQIADPAVASTYVRASQRSSGFTHFFALRTMLYARERESRASTFLWLFDEPGIFLHPEGQHDLLQVLETLGQANQIAYVTHSIFMTNKNYPTRHRLLTKSAQGTRIDQKPYAGQWRAAIDALGLGFPGTLLFASKVLLVEGDSDPVFLYADLQKLIEIGELDVDINGLSIMSTGDSRNADALIRILSESALKPKIALLFDGDKGGADRNKNLKTLIETKNIPSFQLDKGTTVEDHLLHPELFVEATIKYLEDAPGGENIRTKLKKSYDERGEPGSGVAKWAREEGKRVLQAEDEPSALGIAREYMLLIANATLDPKDKPGRKRASRLAKKIAEMVALTTTTVQPRRILEADS